MGKINLKHLIIKVIFISIGQRKTNPFNLFQSPQSSKTPQSKRNESREKIRISSGILSDLLRALYYIPTQIRLRR